ncbi:MAG: hypothetical protein KDB01_23595 [Planctomycetaceae bacterium]|nr:hypothetical protein [Planctomycetaceae bacterium]
MSAPAAFLLRIQSNRKLTFEEALLDGSKFSESVRTFDHSSTSPLVCLILTTAEAITHIGSGHPGRGKNSAGTGLRRLKVDDIRALREPILTSAVLAAMDSDVRRFARSAIEDGGIIRERTFQNLIYTIRQLSTEAAAILSAFSSERAERIRSLAPDVREVLAAQKDTVAVSLNIAGINRDELLGWDPVPVNGTTPRSFLDGLESVRLRERQMITQDLLHFEGCNPVRVGPHNSTVFAGPNCDLTVIMTDQMPLEEVTGTDLIYFNESYRSCVMVQYKAMSDGPKPVFRFANDKDLPGEIESMQQVQAELSSLPDTLAKDDFRLNKNPFFLKICPRLVLHPDNVEMIKGMYIPLDLWTRIEVDESMMGPNCGRLISFENAGRYMTNSDFAALVSKAWIGTNHTQSADLDRLIRTTLSTGRSLTFAVQQPKT